ncbi:hypothetical protein F2P79_005976, partial [Pimephales promelas]
DLVIGGTKINVSSKGDRCVKIGGSIALIDNVLQSQDMFKVVEFAETLEVELVPAIWVENGQCCWPKTLRGMALYQAIKNKLAPKLDWDGWDARTLFSTV